MDPHAEGIWSFTRHAFLHPCQKIVFLIRTVCCGQMHILAGSGRLKWRMWCVVHKTTLSWCPGDKFLKIYWAVKRYSSPNKNLEDKSKKDCWRCSNTIKDFF
jgi:hypothetical protein